MRWFGSKGDPRSFSRHCGVGVGFDREKKHRAVAERVASGVGFGKDGPNLPIGEDFRLLAGQPTTRARFVQPFMQFLAGPFSVRFLLRLLHQ
jgi:hypothetical protein